MLISDKHSVDFGVTNYFAGAGSAGGAGASSTAGATGAAAGASVAITAGAATAHPPAPHAEVPQLLQLGAGAQQVGATSHAGAAEQQVGSGLQHFTFAGLQHFTTLHFTGLHLAGLQHL
jgi:hypothetical protein